jgi:hypothetical protein
MWLRSSDRLLDASKNHAPEKNRDFVLVIRTLVAGSLVLVVELLS